MTVEGAVGLAVGAGWNDRLGSGRLDRFHQGVGVVALVGGDGLGAGGFSQQGVGLRDVGFVRAGQGEAQGITQGVGDAVDFAAPAPARAAQSLWAVFFLAPAACRWARTAVLSSITSSKSRSADRAASTRSHTPLRLQREKRMKMALRCRLKNGRSPFHHSSRQIRAAREFAAELRRYT